MRRGEEFLNDENADLPVLNLFNKEQHFALDNVFYSTSDPETLISAIMSELQDRDLKYERVPKKFKLTYEIAQE